MLQSLDTLIGFVVIVTIVSLFVTVLVQMISAALSLRGKNLANGLALTFQTIDPPLGAAAHQLAARILTDPLLSDSTRLDRDRRSRSTPLRTKPWSALTLRNRAVHLATAIRPEEVYDALKKLAHREVDGPAVKEANEKLAEARKTLRTLAPGVDPAPALEAVKRAEQALEEAALTDAKASDEKLAELHHIANDVSFARTPKGKKAFLDLSYLREAWGLRRDWRAARSAVEQFCAQRPSCVARRLLKGLGSSESMQQFAEQKLSGVWALAEHLPSEALKEQFARALQTASADIVGIIDAEHDKFTAWFNRAQDRAQQWFRLHTRVATVCTSVALTFLFQLDAVEVFRFVSTNKEARQKLVEQSGALSKLGAAVLEEKSDALLHRIADEWNKLHPAERPADFWAGVAHTGDLKKKLSLAGPQADEFDTLATRVSHDYFAEKKAQQEEMNRIAGVAGFDIIPVGFWRWPAAVPPGIDLWSSGPKAIFSAASLPYFTAYWKHLPGLALFAALLTLGAPYWFNLLKNLTSLRPALAQMIGDETTGQNR